MSNAAPSTAMTVRPHLGMLTANATLAYNRDARKEIGLGQSPEAYGSNCDTFLASQCAPQGRIEIAEAAQWIVDLPVADATMSTTFGDRVNIWTTPDNQPPAGVTNSSNTLATPGIFASDMIIRGIRVRVLVEPEARTILGNFVSIANNLPVSPDSWTINDLNNGALGTAEGQTILPAEFLWGIPTWKAAYSFWQGYELAVLKNHQEALVKEPLTAVGTIQPFAEAEAAGLAFASNQDRVLVLNDRLVALGVTQQFLPVFFKRLGCLTVAAVDVGDFTVSREEDASSAIFGGIGVPTPWAAFREPFLFNQPMFWPAGHPMNIQLVVVNVAAQADFQRWLSVTGGSDGNAGEDLNLPLSHRPGMSGIMGTGVSPVALEQSLDVAPTPVVNVPQSTQSNRALLKGGRMIFEIDVIGWRATNPRWGPIIARAIASGAILAPQGYGSLTTYLQAQTQ